ncbi:hypothetical protein [Tropicimonas sediminicola]|uniref:DUF4239 domain-containing protein n=1 Tax=Tropicimonas sediminicola TaxID=1031541 RepID=A0A239F8Q8_9RHOB|nr:hypothetical protein [Tropicimonas sediminicola]SNS52868.1 hypothetical protein SAMN05421757_102537 [Tropicimonas sediminicola]
MEPIGAAALYDNISLPYFSIGGAMLILLVSLPAAAVLGFLSGARRRQVLIKTGRPVDQVAGETTLGAALALLGLLIAFSYGNSLNLSQTRKSVLVSEAAALGTAFLRADYLAEPGRTDLQVALLDYARTRLLPGDNSITSLEEAQRFIATTLELQARLWPLTLEATADPLPPPMKAFVAGAVNEALDSHLYRVETLSVPVSELAQAMLLAAALLALFLLGNRAGTIGRKLSWRTFAFSGFLFLVMASILDMQRATEGLIRTDATAMLVTIYDMEQALAGRS